MFEERLIKIKDIEIPENLYPRNSINAMAIEEYAEAMKRGVKFPPIVVAQKEFDQNKKFILIDGRHRIEAVEMNGGDHIQAQVYKGLSDKDIYLMSIDLNSKHGIRLTRNDKLMKVIPRLEKMKVDVVKISQLTGIEAAEFHCMKTRSIRSDERVSMATKSISAPNNFHEAMVRGGSDVAIENAKGGVLLKAKEKAANVLKEFVGRKMRMRVENNSIILQEVD